MGRQRVIAATDGVVATSRIDRAHYDAVVMSGNCPHLSSSDGGNVCRRVVLLPWPAARGDQHADQSNQVEKSSSSLRNLRQPASIALSDLLGCNRVS